MKDASYYDGRDITYPTRPSRPIIPHSTAPSDEFVAFAAELKKYEAIKPDYNLAVDEYRQKMNERSAEAIRDLTDEYGISVAQTQHIYSAAYEYGHSAGFNEIFNYFDDFYNLVINYPKD